MQPSFVDLIAEMTQNNGPAINAVNRLAGDFESDSDDEEPKSMADIANKEATIIESDSSDSESGSGSSSSSSKAKRPPQKAAVPVVAKKAESSSDSGSSSDSSSD